MAFGIVGDLVKSGKDAVQPGVRVVSRGARAVSDATRSGAESAREGATGFVATNVAAVNEAKDAVVEFSQDANSFLDAYAEPARQDARQWGGFVRKLPFYQEVTSIGSFLPEQTLGRVANQFRKHPEAVSVATNPFNFLTRDLPVIGRVQQQVERAQADFVADTLDSPVNLAKDPAGLVEAASLLGSRRGQVALALGYLEGVGQDIEEFGVIGGLTRTGLDFVPIPGPKGQGALNSILRGLQTTEDVIGYVDQAHGAAAEALDGPSDLADPSANLAADLTHFADLEGLAAASLPLPAPAEPAAPAADLADPSANLAADLSHFADLEGLAAASLSLPAPAEPAAPAADIVDQFAQLTADLTLSADLEGLAAVAPAPPTPSPGSTWGFAASNFFY